MSLVSFLKDFRASAAARDQIPVYCVFGDVMLQAVVRLRPSTLDQLQGIHGFDPERCGRYGAEILRLVKRSRPEPRAPRPLVRFAPGGYGRKTSAVREFQRVMPTDDGSVYILELAEGRVYVGRSGDVKRRVCQHTSGRGSAFTKAFPPTGLMLPRLGMVSGSGDAAERDETLRYMFLRGMDHVRGWRYTRLELTDAERQDAEENIRELFNLCRRCGHPGHFITKCRASYDRLGRPCASGC